MGRFDGISTFIRMIFDALGVQPQPWMGVVAFVLLVVFVGPSVKRSLSTTRARKLVVGLADLDADARRERSEQILRLVDDNPIGLVAITDEAMRRRQLPLAREAYRRLRLTGLLPDEQIRLEEALNGPMPRHVDQELATLERLIEAGAHERAAQRLARARTVFPTDARLAELARRLEQARTAG